ncbi:MAG: hypothetical protein ABF665_14515 [Gluconacetobacter sp.]
MTQQRSTSAQLDAIVTDLLAEATRCLVPRRIDDLIRAWIPGTGDDLPPDAALARRTLALTMAATPALFTPSGGAGIPRSIASLGSAG